MKTLICCAFIVLAFSCKKTESDSVDPDHDTVLAEYSNWYTLKAPVDKDIQGVWGDRDKTLLISTMFAVFRSTDKGSHWQQVLQQSVGITGFVQNQDTLFTMSGLVNQSAGAAYHQFMVHANNYSLDDGQTWQRYTGRNPVLVNTPTYGVVDNRLRINPVLTQSGITYKVNRVFLDGPTATSGSFETPGVITATGVGLIYRNFIRFKAYTSIAMSGFTLPVQMRFVGGGMLEKASRFVIVSRAGVSCTYPNIHCLSLNKGF